MTFSNDQIAIPFIRFALTDPTLLGAVTWIGFAITFLALGIAIWQISLVKNAARAASEAVISLSKSMYSRERLLDLSAALRLLDSARHNIALRDFSKAAIFLEFAQSECLQVQELVAENIDHRNAMSNVVLRIARLMEEIISDEANEQEDDNAVRHGLEARSIGEEMSAILVRLRYRYVEDGPHNEHVG